MFAGVGERSREGNDLWHEMRDSGVIEKTVLVFGQMNEPPGVRARIGLTGVTMAEYFRDQEGQDVLLFIDNIYRYILANMEVSALLGRMPSAVGYQPTLATDMGALEERISSTKRGSITSFQAIYVPADDYTDPGVVTTFGHLDAVISLEPNGKPKAYSSRPPEALLAFVRICAYYFSHRAWLQDGELLRHADRLAGIPAVLIHGRLDMGSPLANAWELARAWPDARLVVVGDSGHTGSETMKDEILGALDRFARC